MQDPKELISNYLKNWLERSSIAAEFEVFLVQNPSFGDFSSNIAMKCWNQEARIKNQEYENPQGFAKKIVEALIHDSEFMIHFSKIEVAGAGFINFFLSQDYLQKTLYEVIQKGKDYGCSNTKSEHKIIIEFGDPNPFKEIHIGHLRNFCIGESFCKLLESQGNQVTRANYQGDVGLHVAKAMWGLLKHEEKFLDEGVSEDEKIKLLASSYVEGAGQFEINENAKQAITEINKKIYENVTGSFAEAQDDGLKMLWEEGRKVSLEHFEELYKRIGIRYDKYYFESVTAKKGREIVLSHIQDNIFEKSDRAVVYHGEKDGLHTRVFLTSQDYATYEAKDLALAILKNEDEAYDESVILTGNEQLEYFQVMLAVLKRIEPSLAEKTKHFTFGHVRLKDGKMSSRTGDVIAANWLLDEAVLRVKKAFPEVENDITEKIGIGAVKYSMLKFSIPSDIHFSFEESISLEGNSGPYIQYSYVRTQSILRKAEDIRQKTEDNSHKSEISNLESEENELLRFLIQFPYVLEQAAEEFAPNLVCNYLFELSQKFNLFYQKHKIIGSDKEEFRLDLTKATGTVLQNGLHILGIETVEKM